MLGFLNVPILRRVAFHARRIGSQVDRHFFTTLLTAVLGFVAVATLLVALFEDKFTVAGIGATLYWAVTTVIGSGDPSYVTVAGGFIVALAAGVLRRGPGGGHDGGGGGVRHRLSSQGGPGHGSGRVPRPHRRLRLEHHRPRPDRGAEDRRVPRPRSWCCTTASAIPPATACTSCAATSPPRPTCAGPASPRRPAPSSFLPRRTNEADMRSILCVMAIESIAPEVRTVVEANNPAHVEHFRRARADEVLVTSTPGLAPAGPIGPLPGPVRAGDRPRLGRQGIGAVPHPDPRGAVRPVGRRVLCPPARRSQRHAARRQPPRPGLDQPAPPTSRCSPATTPWSWPSRSARWRRCVWTGLSTWPGRS